MEFSSKEIGDLDLILDPFVIHRGASLDNSIPGNTYLIVFRQYYWERLEFFPMSFDYGRQSTNEHMKRMKISGTSHLTVPMII